MVRGGPISIAEYMQDCLTSPQGGFYMSRDVFGSAGDFITSPEISQMFGEMVGIWAVHTWQQLGRPPRLRLVELGPGRGTLLADLLRGTAAFKPFSAALEVHLVEMSPALRAAQWRALRCGEEPGGRSHAADLEALRAGMPPLVGTGAAAAGGSGGGWQSPERGVSGFNGCTVTWHATLDSVPVGPEGAPPAQPPAADARRAGRLQPPGPPRGAAAPGSGAASGTELAPPAPGPPALYIAHEFFDALPVHQFVRRRVAGGGGGSAADGGGGSSGSGGEQPGGTSSGAAGWVEKMVDVGHEAGEVGRGQGGDQGEQAGVAAAAAAGGGGGDAGPGRGGAGPAGATAGSGLRLVLSPGPTPATALLVPRRLAGLPREQVEALAELEVSAVGMATAERLAQRIAAAGGAALIVDYGRGGPPYGDSLMAIRAHRGVGILDRPGSADLSAWVDFGALRQAAEGAGGGVAVAGPVSQGAWLRAMGIGHRLAALAARCPGGAEGEEAGALAAGVERLVGGGEGRMGESYQVLAIHSAGLAGGLAGFEGAEG